MWQWWCRMTLMLTYHCCKDNVNTKLTRMKRQRLFVFGCEKDFLLTEKRLYFFLSLISLLYLVVLMSSVSSLETLFGQCTPASDIAPAWRLTLCAYWVFCHSALLSFDSSRWPSRWCLQKSQFFPPLLSALRPLDLLKLLRQSFISVSPAVCRSPILSYEGGQNE